MMYGLDMADLKTRLEMSIWEWQQQFEDKVKGWDHLGHIQSRDSGYIEKSILPMESSERRKRRLQERLMDVTQEDMQGVGVQRVHVLV